MTPRLGDQFPPKYREDFCKSHLIKGAVLKTYVEETVPPKIKLFVIWGMEESFNKIGVSFINSDIAYIRNKWLRDLQHPLLSRNNPFLTRDSFLDCSRIYEKNFKVVRDLFIEDIDIFLGNISHGDLLASEDIIRNAKTIELKLKRRYGFI